MRGKLDEPGRRYEEFLHRSALWQTRRNAIEGAPNSPESLRGAEAALKDLEGLSEALNAKKAMRRGVAEQIFRIKAELLEEYRGLYAPVQKFIDEHPVGREQRDLGFAAAMAVSGLT